MATQILNPSSIVFQANWSSGGSNASELDKDNTAVSWTGNFGAQAKFILQLDDFDNTGVASIDAIQLTTVAYLANTRIGTITAKTILENSSGTALYTEDITITINGAAFATYNGTSRTTSDGSSAWTDGDIDGLRLNITYATPPGNAIVEQAYVTVTYTEVSGYGSRVSGVAAASIGSIIGVATANIGEVIGVD